MANKEVINLYDAAEIADDAFQSALVEEHGNNAGDIRYQRDKQSERVKALGDLHQAAMKAWRVACGFEAN